MKKIVLFFAFVLTILAPSSSFAIVAINTHQTTVAAAPMAEKQKMKKSTKITLILSVGFLALAYVLKIAGASVGILAACYILALIAVILCIGSLMQK